jgi:ketosteroid isomerase-like protein
VRSDPFRQAAEAKDFSLVSDLFADDVTFRSPVVYKPYEGRDALEVVLGAVVKVFQDFRYTDQFEDGDTAMLIFEAKAGQISELIVMVRPMSGMHALADEMKRMLESAGAA